jgi:hypothetical protein
VSYRRAEVAGFWIASTVVVWLAIGLTAAALGARAPWTWGTAAAVAVVLPGLVWRPWFETGVWAWNGAVRRLAGGLRMCVLAAAYYILVAAVSRSASSRQPARFPLDSSGWRRRTESTPRCDDLRSLRDFIRAPGNRWAVTLVPIVFLLTLLRDEEQNGVLPGSTYTLY